MSTSPEAGTRRVIFSISSDIGLALAHKWLERGIAVAGTYRTRTASIDELAARGAEVVHCDLADVTSVESACDLLKRAPWDTLVLAAGAQEPVGPFERVNFDKWQESIEVNFVAQARVVRRLLGSRDGSGRTSPTVLFFAGGGTNNATVNYSAYTLSKISLIKFCELMDAEVPDTKFTIIGPGWVKTKIHQATLDAPEMAGDNYARTVEKLDSEDLVPMESVIACCDWAIKAPREVVGGRNLSLVWDRWGDPELDEALRGDRDMYRLRRDGNERLPRNEPLNMRTWSER